MTKKRGISILCLALTIILVAACLFACGDNKRYTVYFESDGKIVYTLTVQNGRSMSLPDEPVKDDHAFLGWYRDKNVFSISFDSEYLTQNTINNDITVYARWAATSVSGLQFSLAEDNTYVLQGYQGVSAEVNIPSVFEGLPVTAIESGAFSGKGSVEKIIVPDTVIKIGDYAFFNCHRLTTITIPQNVTYIGQSAFSGCTSLSELEIPEKVSHLGAYAFSGCLSLTSMRLPESLKYLPENIFYSCANLYNIVLPQGLKQIGAYAFYNCTNITTLGIPAAVISIGEYAFGNVKAAIEFSTGSTLTALGPNAFAGYKGSTVKIPAAVSSIAENAFYRCVNLDKIEVESGNVHFTSAGGVLYDIASTEIIAYPINKEAAVFVLPSTVVTLGKSAFAECEKLGGIVLSGNVSKIDERAFYNADTEITFESGEKPLEIGSYAFSHYRGDGIALPARANKLGHYAFFNSAAYISFAPDSALAEAGAYAFSNYQGAQISLPLSVNKIAEHAFSGCVNLTRIDLPEQLTEIGAYAFYNCKSLIEPVLPQNITRIGSFAFYNCISLASLEIPWKTVDIGAYAFSNIICPVTFGADSQMTAVGSGAFAYYKGESLTLPSGVKSVGNSAFYGCSNLNTAVLPQSLETISSYAFFDCPSLYALNIPKNVSTLGAYAFGFVSAPINFETGSALNTVGGGVFAYYKGTELTLPVSISGVGEKAFYASSAAIEFTGAVSTFYAYSFENYRGGSVTVPESVTAIGDRAFYNCPYLTEILVAAENPNYTSADGVLYSKNGKTLLQYPSGRKQASFTLGQSVTAIGVAAFSTNRYLAEIIIPSTVTQIGAYAFSGCVALNEINVPYSVAVIGAFCFSEISCPVNFAQDSQVAEIGANTYSGYRGNKVSVSSAVAVIDENAFYNCSALTEIEVDFGNAQYKSIDGVLYTFDGAALIQYPAAKPNVLFILPAAVEEIYDRALYHCASIESFAVEGGNTVYSALYGVLYQGTALLKYPPAKIEPSFTAPAWVSVIAPYAFRAAKLSGVNLLGSGVENIGEFAFYGCAALTEIVLPVGLKNLGYWAFEGCSRLEYEIENGLKYLGNWVMGVTDTALTTATVRAGTAGIAPYAFKYCGVLNSVNLPDTLRYIGYGAFEYCISIESITLPQSLMRIGEYAFYGASSLTSMTVKALVPPELKESAIKSGTIIYVPQASVDIYKAAANWSAFGINILSIN